MREREYVKKCRECHPPEKFPKEFVQCVFNKAQSKERGEKLVRRGTQALVALSGQKGQGEYIPLEEIMERAGIGRTGMGGSSGSGGLWVWGVKQASVIEERTRPKAYKIRNEFWEAMLGLFPNEDSIASTCGIMRLQGLGKEIWAGIDAQDYVDHERAAWAG